MTLLCNEGDKPVKKSKAMYDHSCSSMGRGINKLTGGDLEDLFCVHTEQAEMYSWTPLAREGSQNRHCKNKILECG